MAIILKEKMKELIEQLHNNLQMDYRITHIDHLLINDFPVDFILNQKKEVSNKFKYKFRLLDGDRNIYFEGLSTRNDSFEPLDFFGSEFGCTDLQYFENGKFVSL